MTMKMMSAKEAKNSFGVFLDSVQHEPVVVTKRDRPVGVMFSMNDLPAMTHFVDAMKLKINAGIAAGLEDSEASRSSEITDDYVTNLKERLQTRLDNNKAV